MAISVSEFWKLAIESRLLDGEQCQLLATRWGHVKGAADQSNAKTLADWLVATNVLSKYQTRILLAGHPGPFQYGDYEVYDRLDQGLFSGLFRAIHLTTRHPVRLQFLTDARVHDARVWAAIRQRTRSLASFPGNELIRFHDAIDLGAHKFLVSEDPPGQTLEQWIASVGRLPYQESARIGRVVALLVARLHEQGIVHGLLSARAVRIAEHGQVVLEIPGQEFCPTLVDPSLAWAADYWPPEFATPGLVADMLSDVYALGCLLYQMISGRVPFPGGDVAHKLARHAAEPIESLEPLGVPAPLTKIVAYAMAKNRAVRFPQIGMVAEQLTNFVDAARPTTEPIPDRNAQALTWAAYEQALRAGRDATPAAPVARALQPSSDQIPPPSMPSASKSAAESPSPLQGVVPIAGPSTASVTQLRTRRRRSSAGPMVWTVSAGLAILMLAVLVYALNNSRPPISAEANASAGTRSEGDAAGKSNKSVTESSGTSRTTSQPRTDGTATSDLVLVPDDGKTLWAAPTSGSAIDLRYLPPGAQFFIHCRAAALCSAEQGPSVLKSLGPNFESLLQQWSRVAGFGLPEIDELVTGLYASDGAQPRLAIVVHLTAPLDAEQIRGRWTDATPAGEGGSELFRAGSWWYWIPSDGNGGGNSGSGDGHTGRTFVMASTEQDLTEAMQARGAPPVLRGDVQRLLRDSDREMHVTLFGAPNFLYSELLPEGRNYYFGEAKKIRGALEWLLGDDLQALAMGMHFGSDFYWELRLAANPNLDRTRLASDLQRRLEQVPDAMFDYVVRLGANPYWEKVRFQLPQMVRFAHKMSRVGVERDAAMINGLLPGYSAHNLLLGTELLLASTPSAAPAPSAEKTPARFASMEEVLEKYRTKLAFEANSLEFVVQDIAKDVVENVRGLPYEFKIRIMGDHLQLDGITRNQTVRDFNLADKTVGEILTAVVMKANPIKTVNSPSQKNQQLIWVIADNPDDPGKKIVLITTRQMAEKNKYELPTVFRMPE